MELYSGKGDSQLNSVDLTITKGELQDHSSYTLTFANGRSPLAHSVVLDPVLASLKLPLGVSCTTAVSAEDTVPTSCESVDRAVTAGFGLAAMG